MKKKLLLIGLIVCLVFSSSLPAYAYADITDLADNEIADQLAILESQKQEELDSIREQLKKQEMMVHFEYYQQIIEKDFAIKKQILMEGKQSLIEDTDEISPAYVTYDFNMSNGGQIIHEFSLPFNYVLRWEEYYTRPQLNEIITDWAGSSTYNLYQLSELVAISIIGQFNAKIGMLLAGYSGTSYLSNYLTYSNLRSLRDYGYGKNVTMSDYNGLSTGWLKWTTYPYVTIETEILRKVTYF